MGFLGIGFRFRVECVFGWTFLFPEDVFSSLDSLNFTISVVQPRVEFTTIIINCLLLLFFRGVMVGALSSK